MERENDSLAEGTEGYNLERGIRNFAERGRGPMGAMLIGISILAYCSQSTEPVPWYKTAFLTAASLFGGYELVRGAYKSGRRRGHQEGLEEGLAKIKESNPN